MTTQNYEVEELKREIAKLHQTIHHLGNDITSIYVRLSGLERRQGIDPFYPPKEEAHEYRS